MAKFYFNASARRWPGHRAALFKNQMDAELADA